MSEPKDLMRYFGHLVLWIACGVVCVGLTSALSNGLLGGVVAWANFYYSASFVVSPVYAFTKNALLGGFVGGIIGGIAFFVMALPRVNARGGQLLVIAAFGVGLSALVGVPILGGGLFIGDRFITSVGSDSFSRFGPTFSWVKVSVFDFCSCSRSGRCRRFHNLARS